jgi:hypothetical protein
VREDHSEYKVGLGTDKACDKARDKGKITRKFRKNHILHPSKTDQSHILAYAQGMGWSLCPASKLKKEGGFSNPPRPD